MNQKNTLSFILEIVWWIFTLILIAGVLYPIQANADSAYPFYKSNILFIIVFITFTRLIFLLKHTFLAKMERMKLVIILFTAIIVFFLVNELNYFQTYLDEKGVENFLGHLSLSQQERIGNYIKKEMLFFGVGSVIASIILPFRLVISIWRGRNRGTV